MTRPARKPKGKPEPYPPGWEPFLAAINADLDDDTPRLVFADWLQENGDEARAEFIRIQCAVDQGDFSRDREADRLLGENKVRWCRGLPKWVVANLTHYRFRRGFLAAIQTTGERFAQAATNLRRYAALESLTLTDPTREAVAHPALAGIQRLTVERADATVALALAESPALSAIRELTISTHWQNRIAGDALRPLFECGRLCSLTRLSAQYIPAGNAIAVALSSSNPSAPLQELDLTGTDLSAPGVEALANSTVAQRLRVLRLAGSWIGDDGLRSLIASRYLRNLVNLDLSRCQLTSTAAQLLADWDRLASVRTLNLRGNHLQAADQDSIARSPHAKSLDFISVVSV